jgi:site-specific DNA-methyltransferase (adenine-specific)
MGKGWDAADGIAGQPEVWAECLRVLKPGGHLLAFGGTRTYHRMAVAIEDAGFEVRDSLHWVYGSGFPKSLDVSKAIDKAAGAEREVVGQYRGPDGKPRWGGNTFSVGEPPDGRGETDITAPATDAARQWSGWGTALKPAHEPIVVARKPLVGTVAANVLAHGTGALNIDGCRVGTDDVLGRAKGGWLKGGYVGGETPQWDSRGTTVEGGRWPANLVFTHAADCEQVGTTDDTFGGGANATSGFVDGYESGDGFTGKTVKVPVWRCADGCPVAELDGQSGERPSSARTSRNHQGGNLGWKAGNGLGHNDTGGASRFFTVTEWDPTADVAPFRYVAKPSKRERNAGLDGLPEKQAQKWNSGGIAARRAETAQPVANTHPTVKPVALMRWLVRLVTAPGGTVLDPFAGSGTTLVAATLEGFDAIGIEMTDDYLPIIEGRVAWAEQQADKMTPTLFDDAGQGVRVTSLAGASIDPTGDATPGQGQV